jgi:hypothetical protein
MFCENLRKIPEKINEGMVNLRVSSATPISNCIHTKAIFTATCVLTIVVLGAIMVNFGSSKSIVYAGSVKGVGTGIYWDKACTNRTLSLDWGFIEAGSNNTFTIYVRNEGNSAVSLWLGASKWTPSTASSYMSLIWSYSGQVLSIDQVIPLELTLAVSPTINGVTGFSFDAIITTISVS